MCIACLHLIQQYSIVVVVGLRFQIKSPLTRSSSPFRHRHRHQYRHRHPLTLPHSDTHQTPLTLPCMPREAVYQQQQPQQSHSPHPVTPSQHRQPAIQQQQQQHAQHSRRQQSSASSGSGQSSSNAMPDRVGPYTIREEIGRGSFATVYRGECVVGWSGPIRCTVTR